MKARNFLTNYSGLAEIKNLYTVEEVCKMNEIEKELHKLKNSAHVFLPKNLQYKLIMHEYSRRFKTYLKDVTAGCFEITHPY